MDPTERTHMGYRYWFAFGHLTNRICWCFTMTQESDGCGTWIYAASWGSDGCMMKCHGAGGDDLVWMKKGQAATYSNAVAIQTGLHALRSALEKHIVSTPEWPGDDPRECWLQGRDHQYGPHDNER